MNPEELQVMIVVRSESEEDLEQLKIQQNQRVITEWKDEMEGYRRIIDFLVGNFTIKCISFKNRDYDYEVFLEYLEYSKSRGIKFDKLYICEASRNEGIVDRMLSACSDASELTLFLGNARNFTLNGFHEFKMDTFDYFCGYGWFTVDHMCALINCSRVLVKHMRHWKAVDFNKFLKFWIENTGRLRTVFLNASQSEINPEIAMDGINYIELDGNATFRIQRDSGKKAIVTFSNFLFSLNVIDA